MILLLYEEFSESFWAV